MWTSFIRASPRTSPGCSVCSARWTRFFAFSQSGASVPKLHLAGPGHLNLSTRHGPLDLLGTIGRGRSYEDLLPHTVETDLGGGVRIRVLDLETVIAIKEEVGGEKDLAVLAVLKRTLRERQNRGLGQ